MTSICIQKLLVRLVVSFFILSPWVFAHGTSGHHHHDDDESTNKGGSVKTGFLLIALGGLVPALGASLLYLEEFIRLFPGVSSTFTITKSKKFLASVMSFSVGVLMCTIFSGLLSEAFENFVTSKWLRGVHSRALTDFLPCAFMVLFLFLVTLYNCYFKKHTASSEANSIVAEPKDVEDEIVCEEGLEPIRDNVQAFKRAGHNVGIAFFIHNIPEGLVNYLTIISNLQLGIMFTVALCLHRIPEGILMGTPIYYGYKSKWKAVVATFSCSWIPQMIGALLGYGSSQIDYDDLITGILFLIASMILTQTIFSHILPIINSSQMNNQFITFWVFIGIITYFLLTKLIDII